MRRPAQRGGRGARRSTISFEAVSREGAETPTISSVTCMFFSAPEAYRTWERRREGRKVSEASEGSEGACARGGGEAGRRAAHEEWILGGGGELLDPWL